MSDNERLASLVTRLNVDTPLSHFEGEEWHGIYLMDMGEGNRLRFEIKNGHVTALPADGEYGVRIQCDPADASGLLDGSINLVTALLQGRIRAEGDINMAQRLHSFIRAQNYVYSESMR